MKKRIGAITFAAAALWSADSAPKTYTGIVTDTMCGVKHTMGISPEDKCVRDCVRMDANTKYALLVGKDVYVLSDQQAAAKFAAQKVSVTGTLVTATKTLKAVKIEPANAH